MKYMVHFILGIIMTVFGLYLWFNTDVTVQIFALYFGLFFVVISVIGFFTMKRLKLEAIPYGACALTLILGVAFLFLPIVSYTILTGLFIVASVCFAVLHLIQVMKRKPTDILKYSIQMVVALAFIVYATIMLFNPTLGGRTLSKIIAFFVIMNGIAYFFPTNYFTNFNKNEENDL